MLGRGCPRALSGPPGSALHLRLEDSSSGVAGLGTRETGWWRLSAAVSLELEAAQMSLLCLSWDLTLQTWPPACRAPPWPKPGLQEDQRGQASAGGRREGGAFQNEFLLSLFFISYSTIDALTKTKALFEDQVKKKKQVQDVVLI